MTARPNRWSRLAIVAAAAVTASPIVAPQLLAFPYSGKSGANLYWSEHPLPQPALDRVNARAEALVRSSPLAVGAEARHIYLTDGGWRWRWLSLGGGSGFALSRAINEAIVINRSDVVTDRTVPAAPTDRVRSVSSLIAHETCHGMERRHFGFVTSDFTSPQWLREGYCDHVANESTLSDADAARLQAANAKDPALVYWMGRKRVEAALRANDGNVDALFASAKSAR